ncbi:hypothetical protein [Nannocystis sp. SCPEA4]|uniref:hypothetical protein n=1 Tax=Nannocystis sp. SCPEA4 TaxID=2996787 RepID=UPI0022713380|nr:hypothetical protein [Nannocystis sp. SCPEA4]MCY1056829.1 hypothetical protein [Nannocystis sp. SCPEA4]
MPMSSPARSTALALALAACGPASKGDTTDTDTSTGTPLETTSTTNSPTTGTTVEPTTGDATSTSVGTTSSTTAPSDTTTAGALCDLVELTTARAHALGGDVLDCGVVDPWNNTTEDWLTARDCALMAAAAEQPFQLVTWRQGIDSAVGRGYVGTAARSFMLEEIRFDTLGSPIAEVHRAAASSRPTTAPSARALRASPATCPARRDAVRSPLSVSGDALRPASPGAVNMLLRTGRNICFREHVPSASLARAAAQTAGQTNGAAPRTA